jgi:hypothetical protein
MRLLIGLICVAFAGIAQAQAYAIVGAAIANGNTSANIGGGYEFKGARTDSVKYAAEGTYFDTGRLNGFQVSALAKYPFKQSPRFAVYGALNLYLIEGKNDDAIIESVTVTTPPQKHHGQSTTSTTTSVRQVEIKSSDAVFGLGVGATYRQSPELMWRGSVSFVPASDASGSFRLFSVGLIQEF